MSAINKLMCRVKSGSENEQTSAMSTSQQAPAEQLKAFIAVGVATETRAEENSRATFQEDPNSRYSFDSERDAPKSEICREGKEKNRKCITVRPHARTAVSRFCIRQPTAILQLMMRSTAMFSAMQVRQCTASSTLNVSHNEIMTGARVLLCPTHGPRSDTHRMSAHT